ncbi:MAG: hypothetical protein GXC72_01315 [Chitinophagaceae bacterium]|nr:hypothetical protein [Chitinophagaceae bacterium]
MKKNTFVFALATTGIILSGIETAHAVGTKKELVTSVLKRKAANPLFADIAYRNLAFDAAFKEVIKAFETDFKSINLGAMEKKEAASYKGVRYFTDIRIPGCTNSYLELIDIKKNKTFVSNSAFTDTREPNLQLFEQIKKKFDVLDFGNLDLVEDEEALLPSDVLKQASYKALGMDPGLSEKMGEIQIDIQLRQDVRFDIGNQQKPVSVKYYVSIRVGQQ